MDSHTKPVRKILSLNDMASWLHSKAYADLVGYIEHLNTAVKGKSLQDGEADNSDAILALKKLLETLNSWIDEIPPIEQPQRFGNKAYRQWHERLCESAESLIGELFTDEAQKSAVIELVPYLTDSFGNRSRIDYGTGHETCFVMFLCCLSKLGYLTNENSIAVVNVIFQSYLLLCRRLQLTYRMEPAGSQGVWSLDDYQFLPFLWGSSQLINHPKLYPETFVKEGMDELYAADYMFMAAIRFINEVKTGPFAEHSNQLWNISAVPHWTKVNIGLIKMYKAEVLGKFPIVQHFVFGNLLSFDTK